MPSDGYAGILMGLKQNPEHRLLWMAAGSLCLNLTYVFYNGLLGGNVSVVMVCYAMHVLRRLEFYAIYRCGLRLNLVEE